MHPIPMTNPDTQRLTHLVEERTGYRVTFDLVSGIREHAQMRSARPDAPVHLIQVNADLQQYADYIFAVQCGMILVLWSDPTRVPGMGIDRTKFDYLAGKWARTPELAALGPDDAVKTAQFYVDALMKQIFSMSLEIRVGNFCFETCPSLGEMQAELLTGQLRGLSEIFAPKIRNRVPQEAFQKNVVMNAALALNWARLSGSRLPLLPYESTGHIKAGQQLLDALDAAPGQTSQNHMQTVDFWAEQLTLRSLYEWQFANRRA